MLFFKARIEQGQGQYNCRSTSALRRPFFTKGKAMKTETGDPPHSSVLPDGATLAAMRNDLLRFAVLQLRDPSLAEDVVQDTFAAVLASGSQFQGRSSARTWVFAILKNKIIDVLRDRWRNGKVELDREAEHDADFDILFKHNGMWRREEMPANWGDPERELENSQFWQVLELCMTALPPATARVFSMREFLELEVAEICKELGITSSNCWVILHRARMSLRLCLEQRWHERSQT
jgi:RNA polymerase sigma-70 factor (ECF subfamily)